MALRVQADSAHGFVVEAPIEANSNHIDAAFGGSINAVATIAAYSLLWLELRGKPPRQVVVAESRICFLRPIKETIRATCAPLAESEIAQLQTGRARVELAVTVQDGTDSIPAARFTGTFVAKSP